MQLQKQLGITFIYVTHDQEEALVMSDRIAVMRTGAIEQLGAIEEVYEYPRNRYVAGFLGSANIVDAKIIEVNGDSIVATSDLGTLESLPRDASQYSVGQDITLAIRPEKIFMRSANAEVNTQDFNAIDAVIEEVVYTGVESQYFVRSGENQLKAYAMNKAVDEHDSFDIGNSVKLLLPKRNMVVIDD